MNPYARTLDVRPIQRRWRLRRWWRAWGGPALAGALIALVLWTLIAWAPTSAGGGPLRVTLVEAGR